MKTHRISIRNIVSNFVLLFTVLMHANADAGQSPVDLPKTATGMGLYPFDEKLGEEVDSLFRIVAAGLELERTSIESKESDKESKYLAYLMHLALEKRPRIRVTDPYSGKAFLYPPLKKRLSDEDFAHFIEDDTVEKKMHWLRNTKTYKKARTWEKRAMESSLLLDEDYSKFVKNTKLRVVLMEEDADSFFLSGNKKTVPADYGDIINLAEEELGPESPFHLRIVSGKLEVSYLMPLTMSSAEALPPATAVNDVQSGEFLGGPETRAFFVNSAIAASKLDSQGASLLQKLKVSSMSREQIEMIDQAQKAMKQQLKARIRLANMFRSLPAGERASLWFRRFLPNIRSLGPVRPNPQEIAMMNQDLVTRLKGTRLVRAGTAKLLQRIAIIGLLLDTAINAADSYFSYDAGISRDEISRKISRTASDLAVSLGFFKLAGLNPAGIALVATMIALETGHHYINSDIPTFGDFTNMISEIVSDTYLCANKMVACLKKRNLSMEDWKDMRSKYFRFIAVEKNEVSDYYLAGETKSINDIEGGLRGVDFSVQSYEEEVGRSGGDLRAFESLSAAFAYSYLEFTFATLQLLGDINANPMLLIPKNPGLFLRDLKYEIGQRDKVRDELVKELSSFLRSFSEANKNFQGVRHNYWADLDWRKYLVSTLDRMLEGLRSDPSTEGDVFEAIKALEDYKDAITEDIKDYPCMPD